MRILEAYQTADGKLFTDEDKAYSHEVDLIGEELDGLLMHILKVDIPAHHKHRAILGAIEEHKALAATVAKLHHYLTYSEN